MGNQYLRDDVLYKSGKSFPITELSIRGDNLVLYTENTIIWKRFREWKQKITEQHYLQDKFTGAKELIGVDLFFPMSAKAQLLRILKTPAGKKAGVSQA